MNDNIDELEQSLRRWQPREIPNDLAHRIGLALDPRPTPPSRWWERLGFSHPLAAFGWGLAAPAMLIFATLSLTPTPAPVPDSKSSTLVAAQSQPPADSAWQPTAAKNRRLETRDDGIVLDQTQRPVRRTHYRSEDTLEWRDAHTGTSLQVSYPREDIVLTPVRTY